MVHHSNTCLPPSLSRILRKQTSEAEFFGSRLIKKADDEAGKIMNNDHAAHSVIDLTIIAHKQAALLNQARSVSRANQSSVIRILRWLV